MNKVLLIFITFFYFNAYSQDATTILKKSEEKSEELSHHILRWQLPL